MQKGKSQNCSATNLNTYEYVKQQLNRGQYKEHSERSLKTLYVILSQLRENMLRRFMFVSVYV